MENLRKLLDKNDFLHVDEERQQGDEKHTNHQDSEKISEKIMEKTLQNQMTKCCDHFWR